MHHLPLAILGSLTLLSPLTAQDQPNVLLIFIDDMGYADLACNGAEFHRTPHLDALAETPGAIRFTNFHSSHPVCSPTRASLMTGRYPHRIGIDNWIGGPRDDAADWPERLPEDEFTLAEAFAEAGYVTGYIGKWHLGSEKGEGRPQDHGFDWTFAVNDAGQPGSYYPPYHNGNPDHPTAVPDLADGEAYLMDEIATGTIEQLDHLANQNRPWLLCLGTYAVHTPIQPPQDTLPATRERALQLEPPSPLLPGIPEPSSNTFARARQDDPAYAAMVERLDRELGRVLAALEANGQAEDTIVVFSSDNGGLANVDKPQGGPACCLPERGGKALMYQGGTHVPGIILDPRVEAEPREFDQFVITADLMPTLLDLCGIPRPAGVEFDGLSLASLVSGTATRTSVQRSVVWSYPYNHPAGHRQSRSLRLQDDEGDWKLIHFLDDDSYELYELGSDPGERTNLATDQPERLESLATNLRTEYERTRYGAE